MSSNEVSSAEISKPAIIYLRVSTKEQAQKGGESEGFSIPAQRDACYRKAEQLQARVVEEFVDAGESARSANRPELQRLLKYVAENSIDVVVVHKVDRLARNRVDDVEINVILQKHGVQLVSCTENIDETPSGMLLHGIMSSIAEFYSRNLATESRKGMRQKAKGGGTPGMAPFGYINTRLRTPEGREVRTVLIDDERADTVRRIYQAYSTGEWTLAQIRDELAGQGVRSLPRPNKPSRPLAISHLRSILSNRYYVGVVVFEGVEHPGRHPALIPEDLWHRVQAVMEARFQSAEKPRKHPHYLKGSVYCGQCGHVLGIEHVKNRQGIDYPYFYCLGRQKRRTNCTQKAIMVEVVERRIEDYWHTVTLPGRQLAGLHSLVQEHIRTVLPQQRQELDRAQATVRSLEAQRQKLLQAHYNDAIPLDLLKEEQKRIAAEMGRALDTVSGQQLDQADLETRLRHAVDLLRNAHGYYASSPPVLRRQANQALFERFWLADDRVVAADLTDAYRQLLMEDLAETLDAEREAEQPLTDAVTATLVRRAERTRYERPSGALAFETKKNPRPSQVAGSTPCFLVAGAGFEPATSGL